ncbi:MAG: Tn3 family transposase [Chloroflexota bacterium]
MPKGKLLSNIQRAALTALPRANEEILIGQHYTFSEQDLAAIRKQRGVENQLGFAIQLCYWRYPGRKWEYQESVPEHILAYIAQQLGHEPHDIDAYAKDRPETRREHMISLREVFDYHAYSKTIEKKAEEWLLPAALGNDQGIFIMKTLVEELRRRRIIFPAFSTLENLGWRVREHARGQTYELLTQGLTKKKIKQLKNVLNIRSGTDKTYLTWLREPPGAITIPSFIEIVNRFLFIRDLRLNPSVVRTIHRNRLLQIVREVERIDAWRVERIEDEQRQQALLVAYLVELGAILIDQALDMFDAVLWKLFKAGEQEHVEGFQKDAKAINRIVRHYAAIGRAIILARKESRDPYQAIEGVLPWDNYVSSVAEAEALMRPETFDFLQLLDTRFSVARRYSPLLWKNFEFKGDASTQGLREAIALLRKIDEEKLSELPASAPTDFVDKRWKPYVKTEDGLHRGYYELCVLSELRKNLRAGNIWVTGSLKYRDWEEIWLPADRWKAIRDSGNIPLTIEMDFSHYWSQRRKELEEQFEIVSDLVARNALPDVTIENDRFHFHRPPSSAPKDIKRIQRLISDRMPKIKITNLLLQIEETLHISQYFTHRLTGEHVDDLITLWTAILADALNLGPAKMAAASPHTSFKRLVWMYTWFIDDDAYRQALAALVNFEQNLPWAQVQGPATTSSSDAQFFPTGQARSDMARVNRHYGSEPGIFFYVHTATELRQAFHVQVISTWLHQAPYALSGLLYHESDLQIERHFTDTLGYTDEISALFHMMGYRYIPRLRHFNDYKLYTPGKTTQFPLLSPFIGGRINDGLMGRKWDDLLRLGTSIKLGIVTPPLALQRLSGHVLQNDLALALRETGRIDQTLTRLNWLQDPLLRSDSQSSLLRGESQNSLQRAVFFHRLGRVRDRDFESQSNRASGLTLVTAAIVAWNSVHQWHIIQDLRAEGETITDDHIRHISPAQWDHIGLTGDYLWDTLLKINLMDLHSHSA